MNAAVGGLAGRRHQGITEGSRPISSGVSGGSYYFDGSSRISTGIDISPIAFSDVTFGAWINLASNNGGIPSRDRFR